MCNFTKMCPEGTEVLTCGLDGRHDEYFKAVNFMDPCTHITSSAKCI